MICPHCGQDNLPGLDQCSRCLGDLTALDRPMPQDRVERSLMLDDVSILKPRAPVTVPRTASVATALHTLLDQEIGAVLVVDEGGRLIGIFSERDLVTKVAGLEQALERLPVERFMTPQPESVTMQDKLAFALHKMDVGGYRHLPIVDGEKPVGILSVRDLIRHMTRLCKG